MSTETNYALLENQVSGHTLSAVTLTHSTVNAGTGLVRYTETITPSEATIQDASGNDVTSNYSITYKTGTLDVIEHIIATMSLNPSSLMVMTGVTTATATVTMTLAPISFEEGTLSIINAPSWVTLNGLTITAAPPEGTTLGIYGVEVRYDFHGYSVSQTLTVNVYTMV